MSSLALYIAHDEWGAFTNRGNLPPSDAASEGKSIEGGRRQCRRPPSVLLLSV